MPQNNIFPKTLKRSRIQNVITGILWSGIFFLNLLSQSSSAQSQQVTGEDSLQRLSVLLYKAALDTNRVKYQLKIANHFINQQHHQPDHLTKAFTYLNEALKLSRQLESPYWEFRTLMVYGRYYSKRKMRSQQVSTYDQAISIAQKIKNKHLEASAWYSYFINIPDTVQDYRNKTFYNRAAKSHALYKEVGRSFKEKHREALLLRIMADFHLEEEKFELAIAELFEVIALDKKYKLPDLPSAYDLLSAVYQRKGELSKALNAALQSVKIAQSSGEEVLDTYLNRVGAAYEAMGKPKESIEWYTKTLNTPDKTDPYRFIPAYMLATQMIKLGQAEKALALLKKTWIEVPNKGTFDYFIYLGYGECYTALKNYKLANLYFNILLKQSAKDILSNPFQTSLFFSISECYFAQKNYNLALQYAEKASANQISMTLPRQIRLNEILYKIKLASNQPAEAITHLQNFHQLRDSMLSQENLSTIDRLQIEFDASQKENENELLRKKSQLQSQEINRSKLIKDFTFGGLIFLCLVLILLYGRFSLKKKLHNTLIKKKADIDIAYAKLEVNIQQKNKLIEEKESLIKEVHHRVKNNLQLTMSLLNSQSYYLEDLSAIEAIKESQHRLKSIALIHQKLYQNENLATINIQPYIVELIEYLKDSMSGGKKISFDLAILNLELDISKAVPLGLIINEAITNVYKYAFPDRAGGKVEISLKEQYEDHYELMIKDDGVGLPPDFDYEQSNTLGLILMKGLSSQIDSVLKMKNDHGVSVSLVFNNSNEDLFL